MDEHRKPMDLLIGGSMHVGHWAWVGGAHGPPIQAGLAQPNARPAPGVILISYPKILPSSKTFLLILVFSF